MSFTITINSQEHEIDAPGNMPLLWVLRNELDMVGTKFGCGVGMCGACTVHVDGEAMRSCSLPISAIENREITTIENLEKSPVGQALQQAWLEEDVMQCGYCQAGQLMNATALLTSNPSPSDEEIESAMQGNICRCACYSRIHASIAKVAKKDSANA